MYAEDAMTARRHWSDLSERTRKLLLAAAIAEGILKIAALIDIKRRPASPYASVHHRLPPHPKPQSTA